ncbi:hypothetical protein BGW37DRAFT_515110 [Umbelopsis sp. PMI_123]|nr:hypothetical protein BGW37DRAFT_515110 [Umbelopsis sp. PMI_123]
MNSSRSIRKTSKVLLVGSPGCGKRTLAQALIRHDSLYLKIKTSEQLPRIEQDEQLSSLDFIIFMVDFTSAHSLTVLKDALQYVSADYLLDRAWIVVTKREFPSSLGLKNDDLTTKWAIDESKFKNEVEYVYKVPISWTNLKSESECNLVSSQLIQAIQTSVGFRPHVNPWIINACIFENPTSTVVETSKLS